MKLRVVCFCTNIFADMHLIQNKRVCQTKNVWVERLAVQEARNEMTATDDGAPWGVLSTAMGSMSATVVTVNSQMESIQACNSGNFGQLEAT